eukprot:jgi/Ulvmu1/10175/UM006_0131.1
MRATRFLSTFYIINVLTLLLYCVPRAWFAFHCAGDTAASAKESTFAMRERQAFGLLALSLAFKLYRRRSWDEWLMVTFQFTKAVQIWLLYCMDPRFSVMFGLLYLVLYAMVWPPYYDGPRSYGKPLVPDHFHSQVMPSSGPSSGHWLVMFTAYSAFESIAVLPLFDQLASEFSGASGRLRFGEVDIGSWRELAEHFKISTKGLDNQLPTLILFENGKEVRRLSPAPRSGQPKVALSRRNIVECFGLKDLQEAAAKTKKR